MGIAYLRPTYSMVIVVVVFLPSSCKSFVTIYIHSHVQYIIHAKYIFLCNEYQLIMKIEVMKYIVKDSDVLKVKCGLKIICRLTTEY